MFKNAIRIFRIFGFDIRLDWSWFIIVILVTWSLAAGLFPRFYPDLSTTTYWVMGAAGALGLFASIVLHELGHALEARRHGMPMRGITLFIFGGVAEMTDEPPNAKAELLVAIAGPIVSVLIAGACFGLHLFGERAGWPTPVVGVLDYLWWINAIVVGFNLVPAFPLDGGRVLRSALWAAKGSLRWATRITSQIGAGFGIVLIVLGVLSIIGGNFIGGMWWCLIGLFLRNAAHGSYQQLLIRRALEGEPVGRFMQHEPTTAPPTATVDELVNDYILRYHHKMFPVASNGDLKGFVSTEHVRQVPRERWAQTPITHILEACEESNTISPDDDAMSALAKMNRNNVSRLIVSEGRQLKGVLTLKDLLQFISLKVELEDG